MDLIEKWKKEEKVPFSGWDFSHLKNRMIEEKLPWNYNLLAKKLIRKSKAVLDMGTGGGEIFSSFVPFPTHVVATEGYKPNHVIARKRLEPLKVKVIKFSNSLTRRMPFKNEEFDLILNRHDAFNSNEIFRILKKNGTFLTQQVEGSNLADLMKIFGVKPKWDNSFEATKRALIKSGFTVKTAKEWKGKIVFKDVGAVTYLLKSVPWVVEGFSVEKNLRHLRMLQDKIDNKKRLEFKQSKFLIKATK